MYYANMTLDELDRVLSVHPDNVSALQAYKTKADERIEELEKPEDDD